MSDTSVPGPPEPTNHSARVTAAHHAPRGTVRFVVLVGPDCGRRVSFEGGASIGRGADCSVVLHDVNVSRRHAAVTRLPGGVFAIEDLGSRNGTFVNGVRVGGRGALALGDRVQVGDTLLLFTHVDAAEDLLAHRERLETVGRLTAGIAHDMNNFLGVFLHNAELGQAICEAEVVQGEDLAELRECLRDMLISVRNGADLTSQLLGIVRKRPSVHTRVSFTAIINEAIDLARRTFPPDVVISRTIDRELHVVGDRSQLHQVVMNLLVNARDALHTGGYVKVRLREEEHDGLPSAVLVVEDSGIGMDDATRRRIFEPFFTTKTGHGTGLGLGTVAEILRNHDAEIDCESSPGQGTRFTIVVRLAPQLETSPRARSATRGTALARVARAATVLLADRDDTLRRALARALRRAGHDVREVIDVAAAVEAARTLGAEVAIVELPLASEAGSIARVRALASMVRVVALGAPHDLHDALARAGVIACLDKPCEAVLLLDVVQRALDSPPSPSPEAR